MAIILRLDRVMADRKMSLNELSKEVGISNVNLSNLKTGKVKAIRFLLWSLSAMCWTASRETYWSIVGKLKIRCENVLWHILFDNILN